jgi:hypothetical protein
MNGKYTTEMHEAYRKEQDEKAVKEEEAFRFNEREGEDRDRFAKALGSVARRRLTSDELTDKQVSTWTRQLSP